MFVVSTNSRKLIQLTNENRVYFKNTRRLLLNNKSINLCITISS